LEKPTTMEQIAAIRSSSEAELLETIRSLTWTSHNIPLGNNESTLGSGKQLIGEDSRTLLIKRLVRRMVRGGEPLRVLDLGCLEGGLSFEMAREGWEVLGVEAREENFRKSELIRRYYALPNLRFLHRDVRTLSRAADGEFDVILCCGLLYHLDDPFSHLDLLGELLAPSGLLFLDTHVAPDAEACRYGTYEPALSAEETVVHRGHEYDGRWFHEPRATGSVLDEMWSAVSNERSFWPTRRSLIRGLYHAGFEAIHELFGMFEIEGEFSLRDQFSRLYLACMKDW
jgi:SAM-dependent methyltransferase